MGEDRDAKYPNPYEVYVPAGVANAELRVGLSAWKRSIPLKDYVEAGYRIFLCDLDSGLVNVVNYLTGTDSGVLEVTRGIELGWLGDNDLRPDARVFVQHAGPVPAEFAAKLAAASDAFSVNRYVQVFPEKDEG